MKKKALFIKSFILFIFFLLTFVTPYVLSAEGELDIHFVDVGQGDCTFIILPDGRNILIDVGSPAAGPRIVDYLKSLGIKEIDHLILTHPHDDHIGGIFSLLHEFTVANYYDNGFSNFDSEIYGDYLKLIRRDLSKYHILQAGESLIFGDVKIKVLNPLLPPAGHLNNDSIVLRLSYGNTRILFTGDIGEAGEKRLLKINAELTSQILKIGHHGWNDATSMQFLSRVQPEIAIINVDMINKYALPHPEVLRRLSKAGIKVYRTDINGSIRVKSDGKTFSIYTER
jgi:competence protein ComEC